MRGVWAVFRLEGAWLLLDGGLASPPDAQYGPHSLRSRKLYRSIQPRPCRKPMLANRVTPKPVLMAASHGTGRLSFHKLSSGKPILSESGLSGHDRLVGFGDRRSTLLVAEGRSGLLEDVVEPAAFRDDLTVSFGRCCRDGDDQ